MGDEAREAVEDEGGDVGRHGLGGETRIQDAREMEDKLNVWVEIGGTWHGGKWTNVVEYCVEQYVQQVPVSCL